MDSMAGSGLERGRLMWVAVAVAGGVAAGAAAAVTTYACTYGMVGGLPRKNEKEKQAPVAAGTAAIGKAEKSSKSVKEKTKKASSSNPSTSSTSSSSSKKEADSQLKELVMSSIVDAKDIDMSIDDFPYFLSDATRSALLDSVFIRLKQPKFFDFAANLTSLTPRVLLAGPPGSELYQENLVKALARQLAVPLLILDLAAAAAGDMKAVVKPSLSSAAASSAGRPGAAEVGGQEDKEAMKGVNGGGREGSSREGSSREGSSREGSSREGSSREGSSREGSSREGSSREGSSREGSSREGSSREGSSREGSGREGSEGKEAVSAGVDESSERQLLLESHPVAGHPVAAAHPIAAERPTADVRPVAAEECSVREAEVEKGEEMEEVEEGGSLQFGAQEKHETDHVLAMPHACCCEPTRATASAAACSASVDEPPASSSSAASEQSTADAVSLNGRMADDAALMIPRELHQRDGCTNSAAEAVPGSLERIHSSAAAACNEPPASMALTMKTRGGIDDDGVSGVHNDASNDVVSVSAAPQPPDDLEKGGFETEGSRDRLPELVSEQPSSSEPSSSTAAVKTAVKSQSPSAPTAAAASANASATGEKKKRTSSSSSSSSSSKGKAKDKKEQGSGSDGLNAAGGEAAANSSSSSSSKKVFKKGDRVRFMGLSSPAREGLLIPPSLLGPPVGSKGRVVLLLEDNPSKVGVAFDKPFVGGTSLADLCDECHGFFCSVSDLQPDGTSEDVDKMTVDALLQTVASRPALEPLLVFLKNAEKAVAANYDRYAKLEKLEKTNPAVVVIASSTSDVKRDKPTKSRFTASRLDASLTALLDVAAFESSSASRPEENKEQRTSKNLSKLFPTRVHILPPQDEDKIREWQQRLEADAEMLREEANRHKLQAVLAASNCYCSEINSVAVGSQPLSQEGAERVVGWALSHHLQHTEGAAVEEGVVKLRPQSLSHAISLLDAATRHQQAVAGTLPVKKAVKDVVCDNDFEKSLLGDVVPNDEIGVAFDGIGALDHVKDTLREVVMLPLQRPELFVKGQLTKPVRGMLLFGPPGTGKTMLAKAVASESGANFINISMSSIASKWFGEAEKYVKAVFTLASKISPCVIFIDEIDSMLGRRGKESEHSAMRKVKNELMAAWDGLRTKEKERILVLGATNRPMDLDEAVIRRFPRRLMVDLPDAANRAKILKVILANEELSPDFKFEDIAKATDGYSGSDLKNLCVTAAFQRIRDILEAEKKENGENGSAPHHHFTQKNKAIDIRAINMADFKKAMEKVRSSVSSDTSLMMELAQWNEQYGEGGSGRTITLSYYM